jgi:phosphoribosylformimino-5-aminoimidazole carboxamide ribotide isomerase
MLLLPAIDLRGGRCVRLRQGDYARETVFSDDPGGVARHWVEHGAQALHLVDLDGAKDGRPVNLPAVRAIVEAAGVPCQLGGGLRSEDDLAAAFAAGVRRLIIGTRALKAPDWFGRMAERYPGRLLLGLDARDGRVATEGWLDVSDCSAVELARRWEHLPLAGLVYTDIAKDGMLAGPNLHALAEMTAATRLPVIASGGVTTADDVRAVARLGLAGCIIGRALYEGTVTLEAALAASREAGGRPEGSEAG